MSRAAGYAGEHIAEEYLIGCGAEILEKNFTVRGGEIDIIARMDGYLVFVEVKMRQSYRFGTPGESITPNKIRLIRKTAMAYLVNHGGTQQPVRFDAILISDEGLKHIKGAF